MHKVLVNRLVELAHGKKVWLGELTILDMTIAVEWDVKHQNEQNIAFYTLANLVM